MEEKEKNGKIKEIENEKSSNLDLFTNNAACTLGITRIFLCVCLELKNKRQ